MNAQSKPYEELQKEFQELQKEHVLLKSTYEKDIIERKQAEMKLQISETQKNAILNGITTNIAFVDKELRIIWVNKTAAESVQKTPDEMVGYKCYHFWADPSVPCKNCPTLRAFDTKKSEHIIMHTPDGRIWDERGEPIFNAEGSLIGVVEIATDITELKRVEKLLTISETRYRRLFESAKDGILILDAKTGKIVDVNPFLIEMLGYLKEQFIGKAIWEIGFLKDIVANQDKFLELQQKEYVRYENLPLETADGRKINVEFVSNVYLVNHHKVIQCNIRDITKRKRAEETLRSSEERFSKAFWTSPYACIIANMEDGAFVEVNDMFTTVSGFTREEVLTSSTLKLKIWVYEEDRQRFVATLRDGHAVVRQETQLRAKCGNVLTVLFSAQVIQLGQRSCIISFIEDITEHKQAELERQIFYEITLGVTTTKNLNELLRLIHQSLRKRLYADNCFVSLYDQNTDSFSFPYFVDRFDPTPLPVARRKSVTQYVFRTGKPLLMTPEIFQQLKEQNEVELVGSPAPSWIGVPLQTPDRTIGVLVLQHYEEKNVYSDHDIKFLVTVGSQIAIVIERKMSEELLGISEERFRSLYENSTIGLYRTTPDGKIILCNPTLLKMLGYASIDEINSRNIETEGYYPISIRQEFKQRMESNGEVTGLEAFWKRKDGNLIYLSESARSIKDQHGNIIYYDGTVEDISERKKAQDELLRAKDKAEESDRLKSAFLANMSHEIRTPMNGILGFADLLKEPHLTDEEQQHYISIIEKSGKRMLNIISDIVSISKIESGQMEVSISEIDVNQQIDFIYAFFKRESERKGLQLMVKNILSSKECHIKTDSEKLLAILTNLISNAIKCTSTGSIEFEVDKKGDFLQFIVKDTGIGIPEYQKEIIFERFRQVGDSTRRFSEGAGLGLSISKAYVEMLGGKIWVESELGKGSAFYFKLPCNSELKFATVRTNGPSGIGINKHVNKLKILVAEDDETSQMYLSTVLKVYCREILKSGTGAKTVESCRNHPDIDLVLMDIRMPDMDGYKATQLIRQFNKDVVIIAQTAYAMDGDREKAMESGCNDHITKPIRLDVLKTLMQKHFNK